LNAAPKQNRLVVEAVILDMKKTILILLFLCSLAKIQAQSALSTYVSVGNNPIASTYANVDINANYHYKGFDFLLGLGVTSAPENKLTFHAFDIQVDYLFNIPKFPLEVTFRYLLNPHRTSLIREHNWCISAAYCHPHVEVELGYNIKYNYAVSDNIGQAEFANFLYRVQAYAWKKGTPYNITLGAKNYDIMAVGHAIEPIVFVGGSYSYPKNVTYQLEGLYQPCGLGNLLMNTYDWKVRIAVIWNFSEQIKQTALQQP
jgi:hypothetical protein